MSHVLKVVLILILLVSALPVDRASAQSSGLVYVVQAGDTLTKIADRFGTSVEALMAANGLANASIIQVGWRLLIPGYEGVSGELQTVQVELGESLASLSLRYGMPQSALIRLNRIVNPERLYAGQVLVMPETGLEARRLANAEMRLPSAGMGALQFALTQALNPWEVASHLGKQRLWLLPGEPIPVPASDRPVVALPIPIRSLSMLPDPLVQGKTVVVRVNLATAGWLTGRLGDRTLTFNPIDTMTWVALQGVHAMASPGLTDLQIELRASQGGEITYAFQQPVRLVEGGYGFDPVLSVPKETIDPAVTGPENEMVSAVVLQVSRERLWHEPFRFPSDKISAFPSLFGSRRNYNDQGYTAYHAGLDFYGRIGDPIFAAADGRVVFSRALPVRGLLTILDHGWGVFTSYLHQSEMLVSEGDSVRAGDLIGRVGDSGRVTGPHLHWEVSVGGVPVDPFEWVQGSFP